ncbi:hypothetical protein JCM10213v2_007133 [Rhodosporidiobolus nylandii]
MDEVEGSSPTTPPSALAVRRASGLSSGKGKRSPGGAKQRAWNRRLSFGGAAGGSASGCGSTSAATSGVGTPSAPAEASGSSTPSSAAGSFDLSGLRMELDTVPDVGAAIREREQNVTPRSVRRLPRKATGRGRRKTGINDLPDELLLKVFSLLNDQQGFRPLPSRSSSFPGSGGGAGSPEWYNPPVRIALVCQRWLPLARQLFYRFLKIAHVSRIPYLYRTLSAPATGQEAGLSTLVRVLAIDLPFGAVEKLGEPWIFPSDAGAGASGGREADSDLSRPGTPLGGAFGESSAGGRERKPRRPLLLQDQLRAIFQSCSQLLSVEISGVPPALLFGGQYSSSPLSSPFSSSPPSRSSTRSLLSLSPPPTPPPPSALHHLHLLRLSTVTSLTLKARPVIPGFEDDDPAAELGATALRDALLALTGLRTLTLKGYVSSASPGEALDFAPTLTPSGLAARPLPSRARARALLPLVRLALVDCAMSPADLLALLRQLRPGSLRELSVEELFQPVEARARARRGKWNRPTVEGLNAPGVSELLEGSVERLRVTLHNYPPVSSLAPAVVSPPAAAAVISSPPRGRAAAQRRSAEEEQDRHVLDRFISRLSALRTLDLGGSVVTPSLFLPPAPPPLPSSLPAVAPPPSLPRSLRTLTLRSVPGLSPMSLSPLLASFSTANNELNLRQLRVYGSTEYGWASPRLSWEVQRGCWAAGVRWESGRTGAAAQGTATPKEGEEALPLGEAGVDERPDVLGGRRGSGGW